MTCFLVVCTVIALVGLPQKESADASMVSDHSRTRSIVGI